MCCRAIGTRGIAALIRAAVDGMYRVGHEFDTCGKGAESVARQDGCKEEGKDASTSGQMHLSIAALSKIMEHVQSDREAALAAWSAPASMRLPVRAFYLRAAVYCIALFTVAEFGLENEVTTSLVLTALTLLATWHGGHHWMFVSLVGALGGLAEITVVNMPSRAWRYQLRTTSSSFALAVGVPLWLPCLWSLAGVCVVDLFRGSLRMQFLLQSKLPPK